MFWLKKSLVTVHNSQSCLDSCFPLQRQIQYLTILSNIGIRSLAFPLFLSLQRAVCYICIAKNKLLHQSFGILWYRGHVGVGEEGTLPCEITVCFCMLSLRDNNNLHGSWGEEKKVVEENSLGEYQKVRLHASIWNSSHRCSLRK